MNKGDYFKLIQNPSFLPERNEFLLFETKFVYFKIPGGYVAPPGHSNYGICASFGAWLCMVLKLGRFGQQIRNIWKVLKCGAGEGWRRSVGPIM